MENIKIKEYGGYLPFETQLTNFSNNYFESKSSTIIKLNCGRTCFYVAARSLKIKKVYLPYFTCIDTSQPFKDLGISISYYKLDSRLMPLDVNLQEEEYILWTNYYGNATDEMISLIEKKYAGYLIADNCHAFFNPPLKNAINCYSARKFIGVADGAYIVSDLDIDFKIDDLIHDKTSPYMEHLFKQGEDGINEGYSLSLLNEKRLEKNYSLMSITTDKILASIDYKKIKKIRTKNFSALHFFLESLNNFPVNIDAVNQMYYPFRCKDLHLREKLLQKKVYSPTWWRHVIDEVGPKSIESVLTLETVLLPIDQRYNVIDMKILSSIVKESIYL